MHEELKYDIACPYRADIIVGGGACSQCSHFAGYKQAQSVQCLYAEHNAKTFTYILITDTDCKTLIGNKRCPYLKGDNRIGTACQACNFCKSINGLTCTVECSHPYRNDPPEQDPAPKPFADFVMPGRVVSMFKITTGQLDRCEVEIQITVLVEFPVSGARTFVYKRAQTESLSALLDFFNQFEINRTYECHLTVDDTTQLKLSDIKAGEIKCGDA